MPENTNASQYSLMGIIVHDLKTPLSSIKSYADLMRHGAELAEHQELYRQRILAASEYMSNLVDDLLDLVRLEEGLELRLAPCNLREVIHAEIRAEEVTAAQNTIAIHPSIDERLHPIHADERRLRQVVHNLLTNSIKYNRSGGSVTIVVEQRSSSVHVRFEDSGLGIQEDALPFVFDRFYRSPQAESLAIEGNGLGLFISKAIIDAHGGEIGVESNPDQGSTFWFTLPAS